MTGSEWPGVSLGYAATRKCVCECVCPAGRAASLHRDRGQGRWTERRRHGRGSRGQRHLAATDARRMLCGVAAIGPPERSLQNVPSLLDHRCRPEVGVEPVACLSRTDADASIELHGPS